MNAMQLEAMRKELVELEIEDKISNYQDKITGYLSAVARIKSMMRNPKIDAWIESLVNNLANEDDGKSENDIKHLDSMTK